MLNLLTLSLILYNHNATFNVEIESGWSTIDTSAEYNVLISYYDSSMGVKHNLDLVYVGKIKYIKNDSYISFKIPIKYQRHHKQQILRYSLIRI